MKIKMQKNEMDKGARGNIPIKGCILIIVGSLKESMPNKRSKP